MPLFVPDIPVVRAVPDIEVDSRELGLGEHRFSLVVEDDQGRTSEPAVFLLKITPPVRPVAFADLPERFPRDQSLVLRGGGSAAPENRLIVFWIWTIDGTPFGNPISFTRESQSPVAEIPSVGVPGRVVVTLVVRDNTGQPSEPHRAEIEFF
jgi:hypothetical protein